LFNLLPNLFPINTPDIAGRNNIEEKKKASRVKIFVRICPMINAIDPNRYIMP
jgi:hypothetical protein